MSKLKSVVSLLQGYSRVHDNLTCYEKNRVVVNSRNDSSDSSKVKLISGGGSGHEPAHAGYVGDGMLTACVCGELYSSPSVQHILNAIIVTGKPNTSILLIVKNYTGDRLNFGLAIELAKNRYTYTNIDMVIINDDIAIDDDKVQPSVGRRGLAGTVFYHKIIGAMAAKNKTLDDISKYINRLLTNNIICTVGFTFTANMPEGIKDIEIGKGIHGEPGVEFIKNLEDFDKIYQILLDKFLKKIPKTSNVIMMINNLGGTSQFMMNIFLNEISQKYSETYKLIKVYTGHFLTSLNSEGISVTLINLSDPNDLVNITAYLEYETSVPCNIYELNIKCDSKKSVMKDAIEVSLDSQDANLNSKFENEQYANLFKTIVARCARDLIKNTDLLNKMDSEFGDGDCGSALARLGTEIELEMKNNTLSAFDNPKKILMQIAEIGQTLVGGTSGVIYSLFFQGLSSVMNEGTKVNIAVWTKGVNTGIENIMKYSHARKGDRTTLEPLYACYEALLKFTGMQNLNKAVDESVAATKDLIPKSGRAAYTFSMDDKPRKANYPDPGAKAVGILINAITDEICKFK